MTNGMVRFSHWTLSSSTFLARPLILTDSKVRAYGKGTAKELKELMEVTLDGTTHTTA